MSTLHEDICTFMILFHCILLSMWNFADTICREYQNTRFVQYFFPPNTMPLWDNVERCGRGQLKCDGTHTETRLHLSAKHASPFKLAGASVQSTTGSRGVRTNGSNAGYTMFRGSVKGTGYPLRSPVSPSLPLPCVTMCHHISTGLYSQTGHRWQYNMVQKRCNWHAS